MTGGSCFASRSLHGMVHIATNYISVMGICVFIYSQHQLGEIDTLMMIMYCRYSRRPVMSGCGLYCPTTLLSGQEIRRGQLEGWAKLATYILLFFYSLYGFVTTPSYHLKHAP